MARPSGHYYARALDLESVGDKDGLAALADEWRKQGFKYRVFGILAAITGGGR
jgi:hypothetical protein